MATASSYMVEVLLVEDNPGDVRLTVEALREGKVLNHLSVVNDGEEAVNFLLQNAPFEEAPRPDIILLDLNLPKRDGQSVLAEIKANERLRSIPVVILTTSKAEEDILRSYDLHANCFLTKPVDLEQFFSLVQSINEFWFSVVKLPAKSCASSEVKPC
jgi:chemotaxis family two-component system response regulator Rcp1